MHRIMSSEGKYAAPRAGRRIVKRAGQLTRAALAAVRQWTERLTNFVSVPRVWWEPLEKRQLLSYSFNVTLAAPPTATTGELFYLYAWTAGGTMTSNYTVDFGDGASGEPFSFTPSTTSRVTPIPYNYSTAGNYAITVTAYASATEAIQTYGLESVGNYPTGYAGPTTYLPPSATSATANSVVVDPGTGATYVAESYYSSGSGHLMALTRLNSSDVPDTAFGTWVSGTTYTGTYLVSPFGGGTGSSSSDVVYAAAVYDPGSVDEVALAGHSTNGIAVAIIDVSGAGSTVATSDYTGSQTMPAGTAYGVTFDSSNDVVAVGTDSSESNMVAVALIGSGSTAGELDTGFGPSGTGVTDFGSGGGSLAVALSVIQEPDSGDGGNSNLVLGGWTSTGCSASCCQLTVVGLDDAPMTITRGDIAYDNFGIYNSGTGLYSGFNEINVGETALSYAFNGCNGCTGCGGGASYDSIDSLAWDDELGTGDIIAIGQTPYSGTEQFALWALLASGVPDSSNFGVHAGLAVPNVNATPAGGFIDTIESTSAGPDGDIYLVGTISNCSTDFFLGRVDPVTTARGRLDTNFGTVVSGSGQGYFSQDLGTASADSSDVGRAAALENDDSVVIVGNTTSNDDAVARYYPTSTIDVILGGGPVATRLTAAAAAQAASFSSGPAITSDAASGDLSAADTSIDSDPAHRRLTTRRTSRALAALPPSTSPLARSFSA